MGPAVVLAGLLGVAGCGSLGSTLPTGCTNSVSYTVGDTVTASLGGPNSCQEADGTWEDFYNFTLPSQEKLVISISAPGLQTYLRVFDSYRTAVANSAYEKKPDTSATLRAILAPATYQIVVRDTVPGQKGTYRLVAAPDTTPVHGCAVLWVTLGITTTQTVTNTDCTQGSGGGTHYNHVYSIVLLYARAVTFAESSAAFNPRMTLVNSLGETQTSIPDSTGLVASLVAFPADYSFEAFQLWTGSVSPLQTGVYKLTIK